MTTPLQKNTFPVFPVVQEINSDLKEMYSLMVTGMNLSFYGLKGDSNASDIVCQASILAKKRWIFCYIYNNNDIRD